MNQLEKEITERINQYENPKKIAFSRRYPFLKKPIIFLHQTARYTRHVCDFRIRHKKRSDLFPYVIARHQSVLRRKLGTSDPRLQEGKVTNLKQAIQKLDGIIIEPGHIFSFWKIIGKPTYGKGYVDGMLISNGKVIEGIGGGLCQLSNFLYWIFLHTPTKILERYHHSHDVFPDSGRILPFGSGATILYNFVDLSIKNTGKYPLQLKIWMTDTHLKGQLLAPESISEKIHIFEKNHYFIKRGKKYFRYNELYKEIKIEGKIQKTEKITTNFAPVLYEVTEEYLKENDFQVLDFSDREIREREEILNI